MMQDCATLPVLIQILQMVLLAALAWNARVVYALRLRNCLIVKRAPYLKAAVFARALKKLQDTAVTVIYQIP